MEIQVVTPLLAAAGRRYPGLTIKNFVVNEAGEQKPVIGINPATRLKTRCGWRYRAGLQREIGAGGGMQGRKFPKILTVLLLSILSTLFALSPPTSLPASAGLFDWTPLEQMLFQAADGKSVTQTTTA